MESPGREVAVAQRAEGAGADVQHDLGALDAGVAASASQQRVAEMQAGGRRGDRAGHAREDGLVAREIGGLRGVAPDVRRQRRLAGAIRRHLRREREHDLAVVADRGNLGVEGALAAPEAQRRADALAPAAAQQRAPMPGRRPPDRAPALRRCPPLAFSPRRRAGSTRVAFTTSRSPARSSRGQLARRARACVRRVARSSTRRRAASRSACGRLCDARGWQRVVEIVERERHGSVRFCARAARSAGASAIAS